MLFESASILTSLAASNIRLFELVIVKFVNHSVYFHSSALKCNCMLAFNNKACHVRVLMLHLGLN